MPREQLVAPFRQVGEHELAGRVAAHLDRAADRVAAQSDLDAWRRLAAVGDEAFDRDLASDDDPGRVARHRDEANLRGDQPLAVDADAKPPRRKTGDREPAIRAGRRRGEHRGHTGVSAHDGCARIGGRRWLRRERAIGGPLLRLGADLGALDGHARTVDDEAGQIHARAIARQAWAFGCADRGAAVLRLRARGPRIAVRPARARDHERQPDRHDERR